jgi:hypothetical protein
VAGRPDRDIPDAGAAAVIRAGALAVALAVACSWYTPLSVWFQITALFLMVLGLACLVTGREPWPHCCEHCPRRDGSPHDHTRASPDGVE